jgi:hypothetical protein
MSEDKKIQARNILEQLKSRLIDILWNDSQFRYNNDHIIIPWLQEDAEYAIKSLSLPEDEEKYYLLKIEQIIGEYMEE